MKGSRYSILKLVQSSNFIEQINDLLAPTGAKISIYDNWMPKSIYLDKEAELKDFLKYNFSKKLGESLHSWWIKIKHPRASTPNWDLISTCTVNGKRGILLVEAKAHYDELKTESKGKRLASKVESHDIKVPSNSELNHKQIGIAIEQAKQSINDKNTPISISISRDTCYQLSNRIAHAWWLADQGIPVVLMYLGFLNCKDMDNGKRKLFNDDAAWQKCFREHAEQVEVDTIIDKWIITSNSNFCLISRSY